MKSVTRYKNNFRGTVCLNCDQLIDKENNFCPNCGQVNDTKPISVKQYFSEYLAGFFDFDSRFLRTIFPLIMKPGKVTTEYVNGQRMKYVNPFQLYLHITILFFLVLALFSSIDDFKVDQEKNNIVAPSINLEETSIAFDTIKSSALSEIAEINPNLNDAEIAKIDAEINTVKGLVENSLSNNDSILISDKKLIELHIDSIFANSQKIKILGETNVSKSVKDSIFELLLGNANNYALVVLSRNKDVVISDWGELDRINEYKNICIDYFETSFENNNIDYSIPSHLNIPMQNNIIRKILKNSFVTISTFMDYDNQHKDVSPVEALDDLGYERSYWNVFYYNKAQNINQAIGDKDYLYSWIDRIISKISVALFFLLPIFTVIVAILYYRSKYNYTQHLVFVFHIQTVFFILLLVFHNLSHLMI